MKKRILECPIHGLTLHRCKRVCTKTSGGEKYVSSYTEKCFKCIEAGNYAKKEIISNPRHKRISLRSTTTL